MCGVLCVSHPPLPRCIIAKLTLTLRSDCRFDGRVPRRVPNFRRSIPLGIPLCTCFQGQGIGVL